MFKKSKSNPVVKRKEHSFYSIHVANPDVLLLQDTVMMYLRGQGDEKHDQIGVFYQKEENFDGVTFTEYDKSPVIEVSKDKEAFDSRHILDPASCYYKNKVYLYYSGHSYDRPACIGLALSDDGFSFTKIKTPIIENAIAPEVVVYKGMIYLFYQRKVNNVFKLYSSVSVDGINFEHEKLVFEPSDDPTADDSYSVSTGRIIKEDSYFYLIYGGCKRFNDYPETFLIARSKNLRSFEKSSHKILERGKAGSFDEGAIWFPTTYFHNHTYYLWYEGTGSSKNDKDISKTIRNNDYGLYAKESFSQIGLATYKGRLADFFDDWIL